MGNLLEVRFIVADVPQGVPVERIAAAEAGAKEAFAIELLRLGDISAGRSAEILGINRSQLSELMCEYNISTFDRTVMR
ncbi:MAG: UPF0175 family protein [Oscillatoria princeps RMCB-10]|jgi:predicted HTH domain antitoxin|nr:UPF0175 family protein [Oscillatoria princeps RMCB-10]